MFTVARIVAPFDRPRMPVPATNEIDRLVNGKLAALGLALSPRCNDSDFLRRAYLDVTGRLPRAENTRAFLADADPRKREKLIDRLLASPEYVDFWTLKWSDLLRNSKRSLGQKGMVAFHKWIRQSVADNKPWDRDDPRNSDGAGQRRRKTARPTSSGPGWNRNADHLPPEDMGETIAQTYLGVRLQCARCHNHPFEKWTQNQFYQLAGFSDACKPRRERRKGKNHRFKPMRAKRFIRAPGP